FFEFRGNGTEEGYEDDDGHGQRERDLRDDEPDEGAVQPHVAQQHAEGQGGDGDGKHEPGGEEQVEPPAALEVVAGEYEGCHDPEHDDGEGGADADDRGGEDGAPEPAGGEYADVVVEDPRVGPAGGVRVEVGGAAESVDPDVGDGR